MDNKDLKVLNEIYKGSKMGMNAISYMEDKINNDKFREEVKKQYEDYERVSKKAENLIENNNSKTEEVPAMNKVMGWTSVKMNTMMDDTTSHMSEMLIQGTVMGIIEGVKLANNHSNITNQTKEVLDEFVKIGEDNIQVLKTYL